MPGLEIVIGLLLAAAPDPQAAAKRPTLVDAARAHGGIERHELGCGWAGTPTLGRLLRVPEVVVHGRILRAEGQLSDDEQDVWTRYTVLPIEVLRDQTPEPMVTGRTEPPTFMSRGGTVIVEGMTITHVVSLTGAPKNPLREGEEVILSGRLVDGHLRLDPQATFRVEHGNVLMNDQLDDVNGGSLPLAEFRVRAAEQR